MGLVGDLTTQLLTWGAERLTTPDDLHVLTIALDVAPAEPHLSFQLEINHQLKVAPPKSIETWRFPTRTFGIPNQLESSAQELEPDVPLPEDFVQALSAKLPFAKDVPLWLKFGMPAGYLRLIPWDSLFHSALDRPILRLIDLESPPPRELSPVLDVALCASEPRAKSDFSIVEVLSKLVESILAANARKSVAFHVFADAHNYDALRATLKPEVKVHGYTPPRPRTRTGTGLEATPPISSAWLRWICAELGGPVDVVHFVCHGYLAADQGWLAVAETSTKRTVETWSRFIGGTELDEFLVLCGAWSVVFTSPPRNVSRTGLRLLANQISEEGRRYALMHDLSADDDCAQLSKAYRFLFHGEPSLAPGSSALSIYCHPSLVKVSTLASRLVRTAAAVAPDRFGFTISEDLTKKAERELDDTLGKLQKEGGIPMWLATTQRFIEQQRLELRRLEREPGSDSAEQRQQIEKAKDVLRAIERTAVRLATPTTRSR
jgi:hypothetical protein